MTTRRLPHVRALEPPAERESGRYPVLSVTISFALCSLFSLFTVALSFKVVSTLLTYVYLPRFFGAPISRLFPDVPNTTLLWTGVRPTFDSIPPPAASCPGRTRLAGVSLIT